ncbi:MAG: DUF1080 domain-containing protein [Thermoguttaceae bacterium]|jgi:hypothetical protein
MDTRQQLVVSAYRFLLARTVFVTVALCLLAPAANAVEPVAPEKPIRLFNGKDLTGFTTWLKATGRNDPNHVFSVAGGTIRISGEGLGYLATEKAYKNYHLVLEYKWGKYTTDPKSVRNSGCLLNGIGPDGGADPWMTCLECQIAQGCEGDLIVIRGKDENGRVIPATVSSETVTAADGNTRWKKGGQKTVYSGKQFWWSKHQPFFEERLDNRGKDDVAGPLGQWTRVDCITAGNHLTIKINGVQVNEFFDVMPAAGKILLQNEGSEIYYRNVELLPL